MGLAVWLAAAGAEAQDQDAGLKVVVDKTAAGALQDLRAAGASVVADRDRYVVLEVSPDRLPVLGPEVRPRPDFDTITLRRDGLNTLQARTATARILPKAKGDRRLKLMQFSAPPLDSELRAVIPAGARIVQYVPANAYLVWTDDAASARALESRSAQTAAVQFLEDYDPQDALSPRLDAVVGKSAAAEVTIQLYDDGEQSAADVEAIKALAATVTDPYPAAGGRYLNLRASVSGRNLGAIAALATVVNIEPFVTPQLYGERQGQILAGNLDATDTSLLGPGYLAWIAAAGFSDDPADFPVVAVVDDGVDNGTVAPLNEELYVEGSTGQPSRVLFSVTPPGSATGNPHGPDGHGNINASILAGYNASSGSAYEDLFGFNYGLGIVPYGRLGNVRAFTPDFDIGYGHTTMVSDYYGRGARISSNSWGADVQGDYDSAAQEYDALSRDAQTGVAGSQPLLFVFAAGNDGPAYATVGSPATAKNVLSVGASESYNPAANQGSGCGDTLADANSARDIAGFSSRGPCIDGRIKPDVLAPGTFIHGAASRPDFNGSGVCGAVTNDFTAPGTDALFPPGSAYTWSSGTSHATPAVAGFAALATDHLRRVFGVTDASPALLKAFVVHSARHLSGNGANDTLPSANQGFGLADMGIGFAGGITRFLHDQETVLVDSGTAVSFPGAIPDPNSPVRIALVWTDAPGPTFGDAYVNDLNLIVTAGGSTYRGNNFSFGLSQPDGSADPRNNVESVVLPAGLGGPATITVEGFAIVGDGVPGNTDATDQDFALVAYNFTDVSPAGTISLDSALYTCTAAAVVTVRDSDLAGTVTTTAGATAASGDVETLLLLETPVGSGVFKTVVSTAPGPAAAQDGVLQVADGDAIVVSYSDADNGSGPASVQATADVDCQPPATTAVSANAAGTYAVVRVEIDEPASVILHYGIACNALGGVLHGGLASASQDLTITGLTPLTGHFFSVEVTDAAGNSVIDDNGGACYAFTTQDPPDYFTEVFAAGGFDLGNRSITLVPDTSGNRYHACTEPAAGFGTDPAGGTLLELGDDSSQRIDVIGGAQVALYGAAHATLYVNSNGNLTFGAADTDFSESIVDHFRLPRVAALFDDLDPGSGGAVSWKQLADRVAVTYENVPRYDQTGGNSFQIELFFDGTLRITYVTVSPGDALAGVSEGLGEPLDFMGSDFTAYPTCSASAGRVLLDAPIYTCTDIVTVTVEDADLAGSGGAQAVLSATAGDLETLALVETPAGSGIFSGSLATSGDAVQIEDGTLQLTSTQTVTATYEDADDGSGSPATRTIEARTLCTDHFTLYKAKIARDSDPFYKFGALTLADEFRTASYDVVRPIVLGAPGDKNGEGVNDDSTYLHEYKLKPVAGTPRFDKVSDIRAINQCGDLYVQAMQPVSVLVPGHFDPAAPVAAPDPNEHELDHFLCYRAKALKKLADGTRVPVVPKGTQVDVADGLQTRRYDLKRIAKLCTPVNKSGTPVYLSGPDEDQPKAIAPAAIRNPGDRLLCYKATLAKKMIPQDGCGPIDPAVSTKIDPPQDKHAQLSGVHTADQFGAGRRNTVREIELCIPSLRTP